LIGILETSTGGFILLGVNATALYVERYVESSVERDKEKRSFKRMWNGENKGVERRVELERVAGYIRNRSVNVDLWPESPCRERSSLTPPTHMARSRLLNGYQ